MTKYNYSYGFCAYLHYNGLWPVKYEGRSGMYKKVEMSCSCSDGKCNIGCKVLDEAVDTIPIDKELLLKDELMK